MSITALTILYKMLLFMLIITYNAIFVHEVYIYAFLRTTKINIK